MHTKSYYLVFYVLLLFAMGCKETPILYGTVTMAEGWRPMVYLIAPGQWGQVGSSFTGTVIDSAAVGPDGRFDFHSLPDAKGKVLLQLAMQRTGGKLHPNRFDEEDLASSNYFPIVFKKKDYIEVMAEAAHFQQSFSIKDPSPENAAMLQLRDLRFAAYDQFLSGKGAATHDEAALLDEEKALLAFKKPLMDFADTTYFLLPALTAIRWVSLTGDYERTPEFIVSQSEKWKALLPNHPWVAELAAKADREKLPVLIGDEIPDYPMPMLAGDTVSLRQLWGKRLTLLDCWASWCAPCRKENRNTLVPLWDEYHGAGFQIVGYALDASRGAWAGAIEKDGAGRWPHASDLRGDDAPLFQKLRLTTIPANFLLDGEGRVVAKNLHGAELAAFVEGYFRESGN